MWPLIVVISLPLLGHLPHLFNGSEDIGIQYGLPVAFVEALNITVLRRLTRLYVQYLYVIVLTPLLELSGYELRSVITSYILWLTAQPDNLFQHPYHPLGWERH